MSFRRLRKKYKSSSLGPEEAGEFLRKILHCIEVEKVYRDEKISLESLSKKLKISPRNLSRVINERLQKNFYELINHYRVKEAQEMLTSPEKRHTSIIKIGYEVGFNSKSAFNRGFKKFVKIIPSQFRKKHR